MIKGLEMIDDSKSGIKMVKKLLNDNLLSILRVISSYFLFYLLLDFYRRRR